MTAGCDFQLLAGPGRSGEGNHILSGRMIEKIADRTGNELQRAFRQDSGLDDAPHHQFGEIGGL